MVRRPGALEALVSRSAVPDAAFWRGRRVLLTGHTGFKGSWLAFWLAALGAETVGFSNGVPTDPSLFEAIRLADLIEDRRGDVRDLAALEAVMSRVRPDIVLHLAAQPLVRYSYEAPVETYATNVMGTVHVLEAARRLQSECTVVVVTTDKCYENREWVWGYRESEAMGGHDPYSSSKGCAELVASAYARSYAGGPSPRLKVMSARAGNVIGGGDWALDRLVPDLVRGRASGRPVGIRNPEAIRPWQHVLEPVCGYLLLAERGAQGGDVLGQGWNFGPDRDAEVSVRVVADEVCRLYDAPDGWYFAGTPGQLHEAQLLRLDSTKARTALGWAPRWTLGEALGATVEHYGVTGSDALRDLMTRQISRYCG